VLTARLLEWAWCRGKNVISSVLNKNLLFTWKDLKDVTVIFVTVHVNCFLLTKIGRIMQILATNTHLISG